MNNPIVHAGAFQPLPLAEISQWADVFVKSGMFRDAKSVAQAIVKIQAGQELGLPPFAAMRGFDVVEGKPAPNAGLTAALIKRSGRYDYRVLRSDAEACVIEWYDNGRVIGSSEYSIAEAKAAGLASRPVWCSYASDMLFARALTRGCRRYCADLFLGSVYTPEELGADDAGAATLDDGAVDGVVISVSANDAGGAPDGSDSGAAGVASWSDLIRGAENPNDARRLWHRIAAEEHNDFRRPAALRLAAERFVGLLPDAMPLEAVAPTFGTLGGMLDTLRSEPCPVKGRAERDRVMDLLAVRREILATMLPADDPADADMAGADASIAEIADGEL